jgi:hypothetical protein
VTLDLATVQNLGKLPALNELGLANATVSSGVLTALAKQAPSLSSLDLTGAKVDWTEVPKLLRTLGSLQLRLGPTDATVSLITNLTTKNRLIRDPDAYEVWFRPQERVLLGYDARGFAVYEDPSKASGPDEFERPDWSTEYFRPDNLGSGSQTSAIGQALRTLSSPAASTPEDETNEEKVE